MNPRAMQIKKGKTTKAMSLSAFVSGLTLPVTSLTRQISNGWLMVEDLWCLIEDGKVENILMVGEMAISNFSVSDIIQITCLRHMTITQRYTILQPSA